MARLTRHGSGEDPPHSVEVGKSLIPGWCVKITHTYLRYDSITSTSTKICRSGRSEQFSSTHFYSLRPISVEVDPYDNKIYILKKSSLLPLRRGFPAVGRWRCLDGSRSDTKLSVPAKPSFVLANTPGAALTAAFQKGICDRRKNLLKAHRFQAPRPCVQQRFGL
jgi:hypothetical protein